MRSLLKQLYNVMLDLCVDCFEVLTQRLLIFYLTPSLHYLTHSP